MKLVNVTSNIICVSNVNQFAGSHSKIRSVFKSFRGITGISDFYTYCVC